MNRTCGLILDLDGTLVDTLDDITAGVRHAVAPYFAGEILKDDVRPRIADGARRLIADLAGIAQDAMLDAAVARFREHHDVHLLDTSKLFEGWFDVLDELAAARMPMAVLSNKPDAQTRRIAAALLSRWPLVGVLGQRSGVSPKPDPGSALELAACMGLEPSRVVLLGDSRIDMETACRAGMRPVGAGWGYASLGELADAGATIVLSRPGELPSHL